MWYRRDFTVLYMLYMAEKVELILNNLLSYLKYKYRDEVLEYFTNAAKKKVREDTWDNKINKLYMPWTYL